MCLNIGADSYEINGAGKVRKRVIMRKLVMGIADAKMLVDGRVIYEANDLKVGLFKTTENF